MYILFAFYDLTLSMITAQILTHRNAEVSRLGGNNPAATDRERRELPVF